MNQSNSMVRGDELVVTTEGATVEGRSVARVNGMVVFVKGAVPGDTVRVRVRKVKKTFADADIIVVESPSPVRVTPRCRFFGVCGGCTWQHIEYAAQAELKRQLVRDALERIGGFTGIAVSPTQPAHHPYYYRNKMEFSFGERWVERDELVARATAPPSSRDRFALGLHIPGRFDRVLDIDECHLQSETSARILNAIRDFCLRHDLTLYSTLTHTGYLRNVMIREGKNTGELMINIVTSSDQPEILEPLCRYLLEGFPAITTIVNNITKRKSQISLGEEERVYHGRGFLTERLGSRVFRISANSFFQTHTRQAESLCETVKQMASLNADDVVFDLYSGTGTIAISIADRVRCVIGIEAVESAVEDAYRNAELNGIRNCSFVLGDLKSTLVDDVSWLGRQPSPTVVILDPPRAGVHEKVLLRIIQIAPSRIVYVSCNPATQARDLRYICDHSRYGVTGVQPIDMFPHTHHVENIITLHLGEK